MPYHHGNAREALLQAAAELLESEGAARLSLRQVAERAGLSRQAPYNHFTDKEALLAELVRSGFEQLGAAIDRSGRDLPPLDRLSEAAESYIAFGQERPALFRLMFSRELVDIARHPAARDMASAALARLRVIVEAVSPKHDADEATLAAWSLVHGYTSLCVERGLESANGRHGRARLFARTIAALGRC